ncbi:MAG TPA: hypothetical protein ENK78_09015 [Thiothrix sp.]|nr:hypothetical protein [Thiothrix sp.]
MKTMTSGLLLVAAGTSMTGCTTYQTKPMMPPVKMPHPNMLRTHTFAPTPALPTPHAQHRQKGIPARLSAPYFKRSLPAPLNLQPMIPKPLGNLTMQRQELRLVSDKIFQNESGGVKSKLVHWNHAENFASVGIGHFTWYPAGRKQRFGSKFPELLNYMVKNGVRLPAWVERARHHGAPWRSRAELMAAKHTPQVRELEDFLYRTRDIQAAFILKRAEEAIPRLMKASPQQHRSLVEHNLRSLMRSPTGRYALVDYINFKGEGLSMRGGYRGQNWGALQVLIAMRPEGNSRAAVNSFATAAMQVLQRRADNSPNRQDQRWIPGWRNRVETYRQWV